ncbi:hypothetical protein PACTADRAFT_48040 [Pachysolen tannophilus NRRL Y-2460]|uniref:Histone deacetylase complex subunit SAP30 Sin3 binding domain-containing protein n=1 Tax=Pachysolen tannophilus NRRL Y-2460 TaxID=669874 RepID=A0A1E4U2L5_PACTA|nr:hypothetical protein PACTADRAFT_48040 [Pachysolen tannophilus NRRL Y-2460]
MAPRRTDHSASESESKQNEKAVSTSRASVKARNQALQQAQKEFLAKHINSNGPQDKVIPEPLDFENLPNKSLRNYKKMYLKNHDIKDSLTMYGYLLESDIGKKSYSYKHKDRIAKPELAALCKKHFMGMNVKESEVITNFLYRVKNQEKAFKLRFNNQ